MMERLMFGLLELLASNSVSSFNLCADLHLVSALNNLSNLLKIISMVCLLGTQFFTFRFKLPINVLSYQKKFNSFR